MPLFSRSPRDAEFFDLLVQAGANMVRAAELLDRLLATWPDDEPLRRDILDCEQQGDRLTQGLILRLNASASPPLADGHALAIALDDVVDLTEEVADFLGLYKIEAPMEQAQQLAVVLLQSCRTLEDALGRLRTRESLDELLVEVHRLENEGDRLTRDALAALFAGGIDPVLIIRWKDLFERLEGAVDACEHTAHILAGIVSKRA